MATSSLSTVLIVRTAQFGLGLKKSGDVVIVDCVEASSNDIRNGDSLLKVDKVDASERSLHFTLRSDLLRPFQRGFISFLMFSKPRRFVDYNYLEIPFSVLPSNRFE